MSVSMGGKAGPPFTINARPNSTAWILTLNFPTGFMRPSKITPASVSPAPANTARYHSESIHFPGPAKAGSLRSNPMIRISSTSVLSVVLPEVMEPSSIIITEHASCASSISGRKSITDGRTVTSNIDSLGPSPSHSLPMIRIRFTHAETMFLPVVMRA